MRVLGVGAAGIILAVAAGLSNAALSPAGPVVNGDFELYLPPYEPVGQLLQGTPLDTCVGIGHQALYGTDSWQAKLAGGDAAGAAGQIAADPSGEAVFFAGYGHCVWSNADGKDVAWIKPTALKPALQWSHDLNPAAEWGDFDTPLDGDREVRVLPDVTKSSHNFWQAWPNPHQAWSANFAALEFDVESGVIPPSALVAISLSATPLQDQTPWVLIFIDCTLTFPATLLVPDASGHVAVDPAVAQFTAAWSGCDEAVADWTAASTPSEKHDVLGRLRPVQLSFWSFNAGSGIVVVDNVALAGATTVAEEAARGNVDL